MNAPQASFIRSVKANISYWQTHLDGIEDEQMPALNFEQPNLLRAVEFGLVLAETQGETAELILTAFPFVEHCGHWQRWQAVFEKAAKSCREAPWQVALLNRWGQLLRLLRQLERAIIIHHEAEKVARQLAETHWLAVTQFNLGEDYRYSHTYNLAESYALAALTLFSQHNDLRWQAATLNTLGLIAQDNRQLNLSETRLQQAIDIWRQIDQGTELARSLNNLAITLQAQHKFAEAGRCYEEAKILLADTASELDKVRVQNGLGTLYLDWGQLEKAELAFREANLPVLQDSGDFYTRAAILQNLGNALLLQGRYAEAGVYLRRSATFWQQIEEKLMLANTWGTLAEALTGQGQKEMAISFYDQALMLLQAYAEHPIGQKWRDQLTAQRAKLMSGDGDWFNPQD
jgi:tetratricopeptide (TPR) repeat protein